MSIFSKIKDAIFGKKVEAAEPTPAAAPEAAPAAAAPVDISISEVDVEAILSAQAANAGQPLNWRTSIVDLLKLLGLDSSLAARKELAVELLYSGNDEPGSAAWNIWLHKQVMRSIAANGGTLPPELRD